MPYICTAWMHYWNLCVTDDLSVFLDVGSNASNRCWCCYTHSAPQPIHLSSSFTTDTVLFSFYYLFFWAWSALSPAAGSFMPTLFVVPDCFQGWASPSSVIVLHTFFPLFFVGPKKINFLVVLLHASCGVYLFPLLFFIFLGVQYWLVLPPPTGRWSSLSIRRHLIHRCKRWLQRSPVLTQAPWSEAAAALMHTSMHYIRKNSVASHGLRYTTAKIKGTLKSHAVSRWIKYSNWKSLWHTLCNLLRTK